MTSSESRPAFSKQDLLDQLKALCPMRVREMRIHRHTLRLWTACDLDPLLDALADKPDTDPAVVDERMPYWAEMWPASVVLAKAILNPRHPCPPGPWLELGCGPGLGGIAACKRGKPGILTDYEEEALWLGGLNILENNCVGCTTRLLDWRDPPVDLQVPWILASDVAYEQRLFQPLLDCFEQFLTPTGEIWFAEPGRSICRPFFDEASAQGWTRSLVHREGDIRVHRFRRAAAGSPPPHR